MTTWSDAEISANGLKIHYHRTGGDKPPLILLHGLTDNGLCWRRVARNLEKDYDLIMPDARGHGLSDKPETGYDAMDHAADVAGLIQTLGLDKPAILGHSMGGRTAFTTAAQYPELVGCALLEDPPWRDDIPSAATEAERAKHMAEWRANLLVQKSKPPQQIIADGRQRSPAWDPIEFEPWSQAKLQVSPNALQPASGKGPTWRDLVPKLACPTLLITGDPEAGGIVTADVAGSATALNGKIQVAFIAGAGHNIRREQFEKYLEVVTNFLQSVGYR